ncbi:hypothetical protein BC937DRAFT_92411 [Endogone sp. FLAS-F59071]|nr:hypothetical protein BC937DRAFT_92411 [Endogone sp. FLAS-F59071]|eukprot:RUS15470.1 hypothetical protein BC937DRAFT_92411 [Endogone sp. FLAS-F59071]
MSQLTLKRDRTETNMGEQRIQQHLDLLRQNVDLLHAKLSVTHPLLAVQFDMPAEMFSDAPSSRPERACAPDSPEVPDITILLEKVNDALSGLELAHTGPGVKVAPTEEEVVAEYELLKKLDEVLADTQRRGKGRKSPEAVNENIANALDEDNEKPVDRRDVSKGRRSNRQMDGRRMDDASHLDSSEVDSSLFDTITLYDPRRPYDLEREESRSRILQDFRHQNRGKSGNNITLVPRGFLSDVTLLPRIEYESLTFDGGETMIEAALAPIMQKYISTVSSPSAIRQSPPYKTLHPSSHHAEPTMHPQPDRQTRSSRQQNISQAERPGDGERSWFGEANNVWEHNYGTGPDDWARDLGQHVVVDNPRCAPTGWPDPQSQLRRTTGREHSLRLLSYDDDSRPVVLGRGPRENLDVGHYQEKDLGVTIHPAGWNRSDRVINNRGARRASDEGEQATRVLDVTRLRRLPKLR